ncbi:type II secretion system F family protein [Candidatus Woesearchaeota archaeon]|nr:type II secretion system F family protein [Candidatus Woesearchaeota archaeon]
MKLRENIRKLTKGFTKKKKKKAKRKKLPLKKTYALFVEKTGLTVPFEKANEIIFKSAVFITLLISGYILFRASVTGDYSLTYLIVSTAILWTIIFMGIVLALWLLFYVLMDLRVYQRRIGIENVFPDFLQLTSANIRAGMPIDQALWHAIRPNFGVLAKEMEDVAKQTMSGTELELALVKFADKYDSKLLRRSISLLIEGLNAGGEIGELLDRISTNLQESKMMQKEMSASVTTYAIFISFASLVGAPFLLALSSQLLVIIGNIISTIDIPTTSNSALAISFSSVGVQPSDFRIFALTTLGLTNLLSASIVAVIKKGNVKAGAKYIPIFIITSLILFLLLNKALSSLLGGVF